MLKNYKKGFTLIELLVVIAIIGILASVVLISTSSTRNTANDAAIKTALNTIKLQAEILNVGKDTYEIDPCADGVGKKAYDDAVAKSGDSGSGCTFSSDATDFAISIPLKTDATISWCVDSAGFADEGEAANGVCS